MELVEDQTVDILIRPDGTYIHAESWDEGVTLKLSPASLKVEMEDGSIDPAILPITTLVERYLWLSNQYLEKYPLDNAYRKEKVECPKCHNTEPATNLLINSTGRVVNYEYECHRCNTVWRG